MINMINPPFPIPGIDLSGKSAIITGSTEGLGYATAVVLAAYGASVTISSRRKEKCEEVSAAINEMGGKAVAVPCDTKVVSQIERLVAETENAFGKVDIMVNNAGIGITKRIVEMCEEEWDEVLDTNLKGVFFGMQAAARSMLKHGLRGRIINISSAGGLVGTKNIASYCASKAGVISLSKTGAMEFGRDGITVNAVCPGYVPTSINKAPLEIPKVREQILARTALRRLGEPWEIAAVVLFLASDASSIITGAAVVADMGTTCN
ncbi:MAG: glucose 1-dehydrogenase [Clostridiales Family XIII bacterium]|nr:glucose 1-dehydrogenase [Clostridiales Family XIII bacterium]